VRNKTLISKEFRGLENNLELLIELAAAREPEDLK
jgi:hypothetical protein